MYHSKYSENEIATATRAIKTRMTRYAFLHEPKADSRILMLLQKNGVVRDLELPPANDLIMATLADEEHPRRIITSPGPMVFCNADDDRKNQDAYPIIDLLFNKEVVTRQVALNYLKNLYISNPHTISMLGISTLDANAQQLISVNADEWQNAAVRIADALQNDLLLNLAGMRQCNELGWGEGVCDWLRLLLHPIYNSIDVVARQTVVSANDNTDELKTIINDCISSSESIEQLCTSYFNKLAHLPLGGTFSLGNTVSIWLDRKKKDLSVWEEVWSWADTTVSPLSIYHSFTVFVVRPDLVPDGKHNELWERFRDITEIDNNIQGKWALPWMIRYELAKHYTYYLECLVPDNDSEKSAGFAWWLAEAVARIVGTNKNNISYLMEKIIIPASEKSSEVWQIAHQTLKPSSTRYATLLLKNMWTLSIIRELGPSIEQLRTNLLDTEVDKHIGDSIEHSLLTCFPLRDMPGSRVVYAIDRTIISSVNAWIQVHDDEQGHNMSALLEDYSKITNPDGLVGALKRIFNENEGGRLIVSHSIRTLAYMGDVVTEEIWNCLKDEKWWREVWLKLEIDAMDMLFNAFSEIQTRLNDKGTVNLPHILAISCESASGDKERQERLFAYTVASSIQTDTVSAIQRLLRGQHQDDYIEYVEKWRVYLLGLVGTVPGWLAGRIRATLASLYVAE